MAAFRSESVQLKLPIFFSSRRRHTRLQGDWSSDVCSSDLLADLDASAPPRADLLAAALGREASRQGPGGPSGHASMDGADLAQAFLTTLHLRSEEHTSELQSPCNLVCRLLLEKKKTQCHSSLV